MSDEILSRAHTSLKPGFVLERAIREPSVLRLNPLSPVSVMPVNSALSESLAMRINLDFAFGFCGPGASASAKKT
jgi:hypothetical protein